MIANPTLKGCTSDWIRLEKFADRPENVGANTA